MVSVSCGVLKLIFTSMAAVAGLQISNSGNNTTPQPLSIVGVRRKWLSKATPSDGHPLISAIGIKPERRVIAVVDSNVSNDKTESSDDKAESSDDKAESTKTEGHHKGHHHKVPTPKESHSPGSTIQLGQTGFSLKIIREGDGENYPRKGDILRTHYTGKLNNGTVFETSRNKKHPFEFTVGVHEVIKGIDEGVMKMSKGERGVLRVPAHLAYGKTGTGHGKIPPHADLYYDMELINIERN